MMSSLGLKIRRNSFLLNFVFLFFIAQFWKNGTSIQDEERIFFLIFLFIKLYTYICVCVCVCVCVFLGQAKEVGDFIWWMVFFHEYLKAQEFSIKIMPWKGA